MLCYVFTCIQLIDRVCVSLCSNWKTVIKLSQFLFPYIWESVVQSQYAYPEIDSLVVNLGLRGQWKL